MSLFYNNIKHSFQKEQYLDLVKNASFRYRTTQLRISAHDLEIEKGRYTKTARDLRTCQWCNTCMGVKSVENENHVLFECDLYADQRAKLIERLNKSPPIAENNLLESPSNLSLDRNSLRTNLMKLLSPYTTNNLNDTESDIYNLHHKLL